MMKQSLIVIILCVLLAALPVMAQDVVPSVSPYDLGAATFVDADEQSVSYSLSGVLGVPVGAGPFPVALILHGSYPACFDGDTPVSEAEAIYPCADGQVEARYDIAWQSLADALAARGYLTLIPNLNAAWSVTPHNADYALEIAERHLAALLAATQGQNVSFPEPLNGLADWNQLAVIGHDTGAASAALMTWTRGTLGEEADVDALVLVNASAELATQNTALPDIPTLVVLGECARESRDAGTDYAGQLYFEAARQSPVRETPALSVLVEGANRNYFMTGDELLITDDYGAGFGDDTACLPESEGRLTRDQQPVLIQQLAAAFLDTVLLGQPVEANIGLDPLQPAPTEIFGFPVRTALLAPSIQRLAIMQPQTGPSVIVNALGGDVVTEGDVGIAVCLNDFACNGGLAPSGQPAAAYISSRYESSIAFTLPEPRQDLRMFDGIHFRFAFDPLSRLNAMGEKLGFEVTVTDKAGNTAVYPLPGLTPANFVAEADPVQAYTRIPNFLQSIRIDLSEFADVDLSQVESVGFRFYPLNSVAFFLADVELVRERIPAVTGTVTYADTVLPADATLNLRLVDVTQPGAPAQLIAQETVEVVGKAIPFAFVLPYDPTLILPTSSYAMQASIESAAGDILLATTDTYLVLTQGNPARADLLLTSFKTTAQISGSVITNTPVTLPPGATIIVQLLDITQPTLPRLIALQTFAASEQVLPYSYALAYDPALISPAGVYALQAQVAVGDQVLLATAVPITVLINALAVTGDLLMTTPAAPVAPPVQVTPIVPAPPIVQPPAPTVGIQSASVSGNVQLNPAELLPQGAQLVIQLVDLASASVLASSTVEASGQAGPFAYQLIYDPTLIVQTETYGVQAQVLANGATLYVSPQPALVITNGNPLQADVVINRVG